MFQKIANVLSIVSFVMVTSVIAVSVNLGDELLDRNDMSPSEVSLFATKLFLKGL